MDITQLTPVAWPELEAKLGLQAHTKVPNRPLLNTPKIQGASLIKQMARRCKDGERTEHLVRLIGTLLASGFPPDAALAACHQWNAGNIEPLDEEKIERTFESILQADQRNNPERYVNLTDVLPLFDPAAGRIGRFLRESPPLRRWLLKDHVVLGKVGAVVAPGGSSKSQLLLQIAVGVASGIPVAEHWEVGETGSVIVFSAEDDADEIHRRIYRIFKRLLLSGHGAAAPALENNLRVYPVVGMDMLLTKESRGGEVEKTHVLARMLALAKHFPDLKLIVIDPASRFRGGEENSNEDATRFVEALETMAKETGASVLIAHHSNKMSYGADGDPSQGSSRGASALTDGLRWQMNLGRMSEKQLSGAGLDKELSGKYIAATVTKANYSAYPESVILERGDDGYLTALSARDAKARAQMDAIGMVLHTIVASKTPLTQRAFEDKFSGIKGALKMSKDVMRSVIKQAVTLGFLKAAERKPLTLTPLGEEILRTFELARTADARSTAKQTPRNKT